MEIGDQIVDFKIILKAFPQLTCFQSFRTQRKAEIHITSIYRGWYWYFLCYVVCMGLFHQLRKKWGTGLSELGCDITDFLF